MKRGCLVAIVLACAYSIVCTSPVQCQKLATAKEADRPLRTVRSTKSANQSLERPPILPRSTRSNGKKSIARGVRGQKADGPEKLGTLNQAGAKAIGRKGHRRAKVNKKSFPEIRVLPETDLAHHGILEGPQRYDPRLNYRTAGVRNPRTRDLVHDHFQELDRNQDGRIDPMERVFGRLDIDRDLSGRHF